MEIKTIVTNITHDDLVNLLSTATDCSSNFDCGVHKGDYIGTELEDEKDCKEDKWAKVLLAGKPIIVKDFGADDDTEYYGNLPHHWHGRYMQYDLTLEDIKKGLGKMLCGAYYSIYVLNLINDDVSFDSIQAECILQHIVFGEEVYG